MLFAIIAVATVMALYFVGCLIKIALEDKSAKQHRADFDKIAKEVADYRKYHRAIEPKEGSAFAFDGLWYRVNRG